VLLDKMRERLAFERTGTRVLLPYNGLRCSSRTPATTAKRGRVR
jgi:hypothetical protein